MLATAIMVSVVRDFNACDEAEYESQLMTLLKVDPVCSVTGSIKCQCSFSVMINN